MGEVVQLFLVGGSGKFLTAVDDLGIERHGADPRHALFIFGHRTEGFVFVAVHLESLPRGDVKKREHVATGDGSDVGFFRINVRRVRVWRRDNRRRWRSRNGQAAIEHPAMFAGILALEKFSTGAFPSDGGFVFGHKNVAQSSATAPSAARDRPVEVCKNFTRCCEHGKPCVGMPPQQNTSKPRVSCWQPIHSHGGVDSGGNTESARRVIAKLEN